MSANDRCSVRDRRESPWCWQDRRALQRIAAALPPGGAAASAIAVYVALTQLVNADEEAWPRVVVLAELAGVSPATARRRIRDLELLDLVAVDAVCGPDGDTSNTYTLLSVPADPPAPDWAEKLPRDRPLMLLAETDRKPKKRGRHYHSDSAGALNLSGPALNLSGPDYHKPQGGALTMTLPLNELIENKNQLTNESENVLITPPGMPADSIWYAIVDEVRTRHSAPRSLIDQLHRCRLGGDAGELRIRAPSAAAARTLEAKAGPAIRTAAARVVTSATRVTFTS